MAKMHWLEAIFCRYRCDLAGYGATIRLYRVQTQEFVL